MSFQTQIVTGTFPGTVDCLLSSKLFTEHSSAVRGLESLRSLNDPASQSPRDQGSS